MTDDLEQKIRERAYQIWEREGRLEGRAAEHWERAKCELTEAASSEPPERVGQPVAADPAKARPVTKRRGRAAAAETPAAVAAPASRRRRSPAPVLQ